MRDYISLSLETHLFFARIMKQHSPFLEPAFPSQEKGYIEEAERFRRKFEELLKDVLPLAEGNIHKDVIHSHELVTEFTVPAEKKTMALSGIPIDSKLSETTLSLRCDQIQNENRHLYQPVLKINERALRLVRELICFKERVLRKVNGGQLFTANYPLLIEHIIREAGLYCDMTEQLLTNRSITYQNFYETEEFWNQIMMEHALFFRGLLDPTEAALIQAADGFSADYARLLEAACRQDCRAKAMTETVLKETVKFRDFKAAGTKGILDCQISSIILPLLADHVLREANHYIRILKTGRTR